MTIAVDGQNFDCSISLTVLTMKFCSSSGSELPGCPFWNAAGLRKLTAGRLPSFRVCAEQAQVVLVVGLVGLADHRPRLDGARCLGLAVDL